jgi:hypothetical protein
MLFAAALVQQVSLAAAVRWSRIHKSTIREKAAACVLTACTLDFTTSAGCLSLSLSHKHTRQHSLLINRGVRSDKLGGMRMCVSIIACTQFIQNLSRVNSRARGLMAGWPLQIIITLPRAANKFTAPRIKRNLMFIHIRAQ